MDVEREDVPRHVAKEEWRVGILGRDGGEPFELDAGADRGWDSMLDGRDRDRDAHTAPQ